MAIEIKNHISDALLHYYNTVLDLDKISSDTKTTVDIESVKK